ncbi:GMC oxidoreductase [Arboricoccus pini]|uniref:GMC oxidoreductase n=1 Tax=Arboricoccus pini TaxID=1963835 RepID=A0A212R3D1_9PROT|nr:GMC oxidoreductase [Arboricoccus pini]
MANAAHLLDFVIGSVGTAGGLLANRISANGRWLVLLLEAGGSDKQFCDHVPSDISTRIIARRSTGA